jgi:hypothetical protein
MHPSWWESPVCWICDRGLLLLAILVAFAIALIQWQPQAFSTVFPFLNTPTPTPTQTPSPTATATQTPLPSATLTPSVTPTEQATVVHPSPTPLPPPVFVLAFVPLNWSDTSEAFMQAAQNHAALFLADSGIEAYFTVEVYVLSEGLSGADLTNDDLVYDVIEAGLVQLPADRYIGLTDRDLAPDGDSNVLGWTFMHAQGVVVETEEIEVTAHELGHTFGLCDEYSYAAWYSQNLELSDGCPNPFPAVCEQIFVNEVHCEGTPTDAGLNSLMGPGGMLGPYGYNQSCLAHIHAIFREMVAQATR